MTLTLIALITVAAILLVLLIWAFQGSERKGSSAASRVLKESGRAHVDFLPQLRQALQTDDYEFLSRVGITGLRGRVGRERRRVALSYLAALRQDFEELMQVATVITTLSPEIAVGQEFERLRL